MFRRFMLALWLLAALEGHAGQVVEDRGVDAAGGGAATAGPYFLMDTVGQWAVGLSSSATYALAHGFWNAPDSASPPTAATLLSFRAVREGLTAVALTWTTGVEFDLLGFHVERLEPAGTWSRVNARILPANGSSRPKDYAIRDGQAVPSGPAKYRLLQVDLHGGLRVLDETEAVTMWSARISVTNGSVELEVEGIAGTRTVVLSTTDVVHGPWTMVGEVEIGEPGTGVLSVPLAGEDAARFYRWVNSE